MGTLIEFKPGGLIECTGKYIIFHFDRKVEKCTVNIKLCITMLKIYYILEYRSLKKKKKIYYRIQQFTISKMIAVELKIEMKIN